MTQATTHETPATITLGRGTPAQRVFVVSAGTGALAQDVWITAAVRRAGLDRLELPKDASEFDAFLTGIVARVFDAGLVSDLIAGVLVEDARRASLTGADAWRAYLNEVRDYVATIENPEEKSELFRLLGHIVLGFLGRARNS